MSRANLRWLPPFTLIASFLGAIALVIVVVIICLTPPMQDLHLLVLFMGSTGGVSLGLSYLLQQRRVVQWLTSLRWTLLATTLLTVLLVFVNVWVTAQLMFISYHDLVLTTMLLIFGGIVAVIANSIIAHTWIERIHA
ncbi:MAG: hypothetical protein H7Y11_01030, partial [Armatimonadetes bacterium]|nr:hypothetical protein [Anaerolineae bacterium]